MLRNAILLSILWVNMVSCIPYLPYPQLAPTDPYRYVLNGRRSCQDSTKGAVARLAWKSFDRETLKFYMEVFNDSSKPFLFDPAGCFAKGDPYDKDRPFVAAINPENVLNLYAANIADRQTSVYNYTVTNSVSNAAGASAVIATDRPTQLFTNDARENDYYNRRFGYQANGNNLQATKANYEATLLRANTLMPKQMIQGEMIFPRMDKANSIRITCPSLDSSFSFNFVQKLYENLNADVSVPQ